ncbi:MAG: sigma-70 family RNA polymerase sigma factor [Verrucomicrobiota bacterium]|nr:sigma-70 family RNA polymerase sigma factor [Verrucomicrobiota bacterium]
MSYQTAVSPAEDVELLRRTGQGDHQSLQELYRRYSRPLLSTAYRVLNNAKDAEDVLQEAFIQIWEKASVYDVRRGKPFTWAMTLTRNKAIDRLRRVQRRHRLQDDIEKEATVWERTHAMDSSDVAASRETEKMVRNAVIELSPDQRRAIEMAYFGGLTQNEIAAQLHEPLGTVKARIRRGMAKLRLILERKL